MLELVPLAGIGRERLRLGEPLHLARVELAEVDRLGRVAVGLGPGLAYLEDHHRRELVLAPADRRGDAEDERRALLGGRPAPGREGLRGGVDGAAASAVPSGNRPMTCLKLQGFTDWKLFGAPDLLAADPVFPLDRQPLFDLRERGAEGPGVRVDGEIGERLVAKFRKQGRSLRPLRKASIYQRLAACKPAGARRRILHEMDRLRRIRPTAVVRPLRGARPQAVPVHRLTRVFLHWTRQPAGPTRRAFSFWRRF